jgi:hypothetical protein
LSLVIVASAGWSAAVEAVVSRLALSSRELHAAVPTMLRSAIRRRAEAFTVAPVRVSSSKYYLARQSPWSSFERDSPVRCS